MKVEPGEIFEWDNHSCFFSKDATYLEFRKAWLAEWEYMTKRDGATKAQLYDVVSSGRRILTGLLLAAAIASGIVWLLLFVWSDREVWVAVATNLMKADGYENFVGMASKIWWMSFIVSASALVWAGAGELFFPFGVDSPLVKRRRDDMRSWARFWWMEKAGAHVNFDAPDKHVAM